MFIVFTVHTHLVTNHYIQSWYNKWDNTISRTTCARTNPEAQSGLVLVPMNTQDNMDQIRTEYGQYIDRKPTKQRQEIQKTNQTSTGN
jgi:hypothetical protein